MLSPLDTAIVELALKEDLLLGDVTTDGMAELFALDSILKSQLVTHSACVVSGLEIANQVFQMVDSSIIVNWQVSPGQAVPPQTVLAIVTGPATGILKAERTALNFLQHLCGVATHTRRFVEAVKGTPCRIAATRKTTPGLRMAEKQAVMDGGGYPHRFNLGTCAMVKDNHIQAAGSLFTAVQALKKRLDHTLKVEVEADTLLQVDEALKAGADIILLDNMTLADLKSAVTRIAGKAITEASGGITLDTVLAVAQTGVDIISTSQITLGAPAIDIGLDVLPVTSSTPAICR